MRGQKIDKEKFPVAITLRFATEAKKREFLGGLIDGFGENYCDVDWAWADAPYKSAYKADEFTINPVDPNSTVEES